MAKRKEIIYGDGGVRIDQFWKDNSSKVLAVTAAIGAGAAALLLVKAFFDMRRRKKIEAELVRVNVPQFVEEAVILGEDHGGERVAVVAAELAGHTDDVELSDALSAVGAIAGETRKKRN